MKASLIFAALLSLAVASPLANPQEETFPQCTCEPPICPLELVAECKCKNAAAQACFYNWAAEGVQCPKPVLQNCDDIISGRQILPQPCGGFLGLTCPDGFTCVDDPSDSCDPENGGADCIGVCQREAKL